MDGQVDQWSEDNHADQRSEPCSHGQLIQFKLNDWLVILSVILLIIINAMVIFGNILVILSVFVSQKLRTSTNYFIVSLAVADLLVGIAVIPYSVTLEVSPFHILFFLLRVSQAVTQVLDVWIFGEIWCQGWLVVDVWMCTASILNLCAISVDRYLAVTRPVQYRSMMTSGRAKMVIFVVWLMSFLICFPPLVGWNGQTSFSKSFQQGGVGAELSSSTIDYSSSNASTMSLNFSSSQDTRFLPAYSSPSSPSSQSVSSSSSSVDRNISCSISNTSCTLFNDKGYVIYSALGSFWVPMLFMLFFYWRIYLVASRTTKALKRGYKSTKKTRDGLNASDDGEHFTLRMHRGTTTASSDETHNSSVPSPRLRHPHQDVYKKPTIIETRYDETSDIQVHVEDVELMTGRSKGSRLNPSTGILVDRSEGRHRLSPSTSIHSNLGVLLSPCSSRTGSARSSAASTRVTRRTNTGKFQARRFHAETKAAKTVGIIVGGFIICWLPFFTAYLIRAFCENMCIPQILMSVFTWLGYCNSAINPVIYGLFSRDFRRAFKTIVCKCTFREDVGVSSLIRQIHLPTFLAENEDTIVRSADLETEFR